jgi:Conjugal transfer protein TraD
VRTWQVERRKCTRHLIELGGLVVKAGIVDLTGDDRATIIGAPLLERRQAQDGCNQLYLVGRRPGPNPGGGVLAPYAAPILCPGRHRRECAAQAAGNKEIPLSPIAIEVVRRIDALFERSINGKSSEERLQVRQTLSRPLVKDLQIICANSSPSCRGDMTWPRRLITS